MAAKVGSGAVAQPGQKIAESAAADLWERFVSDASTAAPPAWDRLLSQGSTTSSCDSQVGSDVASDDGKDADVAATVSVSLAITVLAAVFLISEGAPAAAVLVPFGCVTCAGALLLHGHTGRDDLDLDLDVDGCGQGGVDSQAAPGSLAAAAAGVTEPEEGKELEDVAATVSASLALIVLGAAAALWLGAPPAAAALPCGLAALAGALFVHGHSGRASGHGDYTPNEDGDVAPVDGKGADAVAVVPVAVALAAAFVLALAPSACV